MSFERTEAYSLMPCGSGPRRTSRTRRTSGTCRTTYSPQSTQPSQRTRKVLGSNCFANLCDLGGLCGDPSSHLSHRADSFRRPVTCAAETRHSLRGIRETTVSERAALSRPHIVIRKVSDLFRIRNLRDEMP